MHYSQILPFRPLPAILLQIPLARCHVHYKDSCWHYSDCLQLEMEITCLCSYDFTHSTPCSDKMSYKNCKTGTSFNQRIRSCSSSLYHISGTQYTWSCVHYIFHIYTFWQIKKWGLWQPSSPIPPLYPPPQWIQSNGDVHVRKHWNCMEELLSPLHFFGALLWYALQQEYCVLTMTGWSVGPWKGHIASLWRYGGRLPLSSECRPSSSGLSDQHTQLHQAHHTWPWH
jgi:hypothetical protein